MVNICRERGEKREKKREVRKKERGHSYLNCGPYFIVTEQNQPGEWGKCCIGEEGL